MPIIYNQNLKSNIINSIINFIFIEYYILFIIIKLRKSQIKMEADCKRKIFIDDWIKKKKINF